MRAMWTDVDDILRLGGRSAVATAERRELLRLTAYAIAFALLYGAVMGSYAGFSGRHSRDDLLLQMIFSALKAPLLLAATCLVSLPSFFILNTLCGVRDDFAEAARAITATQAGVSVILASLAPLTFVWYLTSLDYPAAILFNATMFAVASVAGQKLLHGHYRRLIACNRRHRILMWVWLGLYAFVGIQMGWMLRPFIGSPDAAVEFLRKEPLDNAYIIVGRLIVGAFL